MILWFDVDFFPKLDEGSNDGRFNQSINGGQKLVQQQARGLYAQEKTRLGIEPHYFLTFWVDLEIAAPTARGHHSVVILKVIH